MLDTPNQSSGKTEECSARPWVDAIMRKSL